MLKFDTGVSWPVAGAPEPKEFTHGFPMLPGQYVELSAAFDGADPVDALIESIGEKSPPDPVPWNEIEEHLRDALSLCRFTPGQRIRVLLGWWFTCERCGGLQGTAECSR